MPSRRVPWPLHVASVVTWAGVGFPAFVLLLRRPQALADPLWPWRGVLYVAWIVSCAGATRGEVRWHDAGRLGFLLAQSASALGLVWTAPGSSAIILLFPVVGEAAFLLSTRRALLIAALQTAGLAAIAGAALPAVDAAVTVVCIAGGETFALGAGTLAASERRAREETARVNAELQATQGLLAESVRESERVRISRDLHDTLGHHLTALSVNLEVAGHLAEGKAAEHVAQAHALAKLLLADVRAVVSAMHEGQPVDLGGALATLVAGVPQPAIHLSVSPQLRLDDAALVHAVFRCVQEIVTNTVRHAQARNLWIEVRRVPGGIAVEARDDGRGAPAYRPGHGLTGMGERLHELGGSLVVASHPGRGFEVRALLPESGASV
jgi:signal transduction histidine kinase